MLYSHTYDTMNDTMIQNASPNYINYLLLYKIAQLKLHRTQTF